MKAGNFNILALLGHLLYMVNMSTSLPTTTPTEQTVSYDGGAKQITYITKGPSTGPLLIFLHGWPAVAETWNHQIDHFAGLGYHVIAPDMPGYANSTANLNLEDYAHENIIRGLLALLATTGHSSAIWIGHDWGAAVGSSLAATHPEVVDAMAWLAVPYKTIELGLVEVLPFVNRTTYPIDQYPYGQWEYMRYYETDFDRATSVFNSDVDYSIKALYTGAHDNASIVGTRSPLSQVRIDGGWFGGVNQLPSSPNTIPLDTSVLTPEIFTSLSRKLNTSKFGPADAYYMNHDRNRAFNLANQKNQGYLDHDLPCLFIQAKYDTVCDTVTSDLLSPMPKYCRNYSFASVDAAHWLALEKPDDVNRVLEGWLVEKCGVVVG